MLNKVMFVCSDFLGNPCVTICPWCVSPEPCFPLTIVIAIASHKLHIRSIDGPLRVIDLTHLVFTKQVSDAYLGVFHSMWTAVPCVCQECCAPCRGFTLLITAICTLLRGHMGACAVFPVTGIVL